MVRQCRARRFGTGRTGNRAVREQYLQVLRRLSVGSGSQSGAGACERRGEDRPIDAKLLSRTRELRVRGTSVLWAHRHSAQLYCFLAAASVSHPPSPVLAHSLPSFSVNPSSGSASWRFSTRSL